MRKQYVVMLTQAQRHQLEGLISAGSSKARTLAHARIILKADQGPEGPGWKDTDIAAAVEVSRPTVERMHSRFCQEGLKAALHSLDDSTNENSMENRKLT